MKESLLKAKTYFPTTSDKVTPSESNKSNAVRYNDFVEVELPKGADKETLKDGSVRNVKMADKKRSQHNEYNVIRIKSMGGENYPLTDEDSAQRTDLFTNVKAKDLILNPKGASIYKEDDFLFSKEYAKVPLNRLITLRRFAYPIFDDIYTKEVQTEPDISRMIGYSTQDQNKLSEIMSFSCGQRWKELKSEFSQGNMIGSQDGVNGLMRQVLKFTDPKFGREALRGPNEMAYDPLHDQNKVYGPVDSIDSMNIRDIGLDFNQEINLTFNYVMRSINGINQKTAFLDLLSNILLLATNDAKFWGGARYWVGARPSKYASMLRQSSAKDFDSYLKQSTVNFKSFIGSVGGGEGASLKDNLKNIAQNALNLGFGKMLNTIGRASIPSMNSLLTGNPTGQYHLTIGNPMNPILCMGDLILTNTNISFGDELGYDDFPTELKVEVTLKHNKPRGRAEIEQMFNVGKGRIYFKPREVVKHHTARSTKAKPKPFQGLISNGVDLAFGDYKKQEILRNSNEVWSFLKTTVS